MASYYDAYDDGAEDVLKNTEELVKIPEVQALIEKEKAAAVAAKMATVDVIGDPARMSVVDSTFYGCYGAVTAFFPAATSIGKSAFESCTNLTTANFPAVTSIGESAFNGCTSLTDLTLSSMTVAEVTAGASTWKVPSGCVVHCKDGDYTVPQAA